MGFAAAAIWFIVDTGKGQLVIESVDANVEIKLRQDGKVLDELRIEPGTKVTRLWGGKYEILLDAGSDNFSVSNDSFTIRRGETVIARITPKQSTNSINPGTTGEAASNFAPSESSTVDERLDQIVYKGETLDTWLRRLRFERDTEEREEALGAVLALASPELSDLITPAMIEVLHDQPSQSKALYTLAKLNGKDLWPSMQSVFDSTTEPNSVESLAGSLGRITDYVPRFSTPQTSKPLLDWIAQHVSIVRQDRNFQKLLSWLCGIADGVYGRTSANAATMPDETRAALIAMLRQCETDDPTLTAELDRLVWFRQPEETDKPGWSEPTRQEVLRRAIRLLADDTADRALRCQAGISLVSMARNRFTVTGDQKTALVHDLNQQLNAATANLNDHSWSVDVDGEFRIGETFRHGSDLELPKRDPLELFLAIQIRGQSRRPGDVVAYRRTARRRR